MSSGVDCLPYACWSGLQTRQLPETVFGGNTIGDRQMATGTVKWYNTTKGYGFIQPDDGGKDAFVHATAVETSGMRTLNEGQRVEFDLQADKRSGKEAAVNLKAVD
jgi:cold shock protein